MKSLFLAVVLAAVCLCRSESTSHVEDCPPGWLKYSSNSENTCMWFSDSTGYPGEGLENACDHKNASMVVISTEDKFNYLKRTLKNIGLYDTDFWFALYRMDDGTFMWQTNDKNVTAEFVPQAIKSYRYNRYWRSGQGFVYNFKNNQVNNDPGYSGRWVCETNAICQKGWYGYNCDKECHCHDQECEPTDLEVTCLYGCQVGWMGPGCSQPKEDADIRYFCVNSEDQGKYAQFIIDTKGVKYESMSAVDDNGESKKWCENTKIVHSANFVIIKTHVDNVPLLNFQDGTCPGKLTGDDKYEWRLKLEEYAGLVSRTNQEVSIECDFSKGDKFLISDDTEIIRERWFRRSDIRKPVEYLQEQREGLKIEIVDPSTDMAIDETKIGSPVALRISFGTKQGNVATGVLPYNCYAESKDVNQKKMLLDNNGCVVEGSPISKFHKTDDNHVMTKPFGLFGFSGSESVEFYCSYHLCFGDAQCQPDCSEETTTRPSRRRRRSASNVERKVTTSVAIIRLP